MVDLRSELKRLNPTLYAAYERSLEIATNEWLPLIPAKNDSHNAYPHLLNIEQYVSTILFEESNKEHHGLVFTDSELYVMLSSILFHDIGKGYQFENDGLGVKVDHSVTSQHIITRSWAEIRIESEQFAKIISLVCLYHDCGDAEWDDLENSLSNFMYVDHYGKIRARSIAALLFLADHMDGTYTRSAPDYMGEHSKKPVGMFRKKIQSVRADLKNKMVCTILETNNLEQEDFLNVTAYKSRIRNKPEKQAKEYDKYGITMMSGNTLQEFLAKSSNKSEAISGIIAQSEAINLIVKDVYTNNKALEKIRNELYEMGMPLLEWFIECNNILFRPKDTRGTEAAQKVCEKNEQHYPCFDCKKAFEPILDLDTLKHVFIGIIEISSGSFGEKYFDYYTILNYMRESDANLHKIKCAVKRLSLLLESANNGVHIYYDDVVWCVSTSALDEIKQIINAADKRKIEFSAIADRDAIEYLIHIFKGMLEIHSKNPGSGPHPYEKLHRYTRDTEIRTDVIKRAAENLASLLKDVKKECIKITCEEKKWQLSIDTNDITKELIKSAAGIIASMAKEKDSGDQTENTPAKNGESNAKKKNRPFKYDVDRSIVFSDNLDLLLCKNPHHESLNRYKTSGLYADEKKTKTCRTWERHSKYELYEIISGCKNCKCDNCRPEERNNEKSEHEPCNCDYCKKCPHRNVFHPSIMCQYVGGLILPYKNERPLSLISDSECSIPVYNDGSGNTIIVGGYGTGKSTLAFQMAAACADEINKGISVYYSLESSRMQTIENFVMDSSGVEDEKLRERTKAEINERINMYSYLDMFGENNSLTSERLCDMLRQSLKNSEGVIKPQILFPMLSPRGVETPSGSSGLFAKRYKELEYMLKAINLYNAKYPDKDNSPRIKLVVVDSLNVFSDTPLMREEISRLFDLFKRNNILGVFTLEDCVQEDVVGSNYIGSIKYGADVVIALRTSYFNHHKETFFEVEKSRNVCPIAGHHLYKIRENGRYNKDIGNIARKKLEVYPSLHYILSASADKTQGRLITSTKNIFNIAMLDDILPQHVMRREERYSQVVTITGDSGLYKSDLAINSLLSGMTLGENGMIIRLNDRDLFEEDGVRLEQSVYERLKNRGTHGSRVVFERSAEEYTPPINAGYKITGSLWKYKYTNRNADGTVTDPAESSLLEVVFKSGALLPEEFVDAICQAINDYKIKRVAFIDLKTIGISYPFLINSETSGDMFISAFIHLLRNYGVHLIMSSTNSAVQTSDKEVKKACGLSDAVITCKTKKNQVYLSGVGSIGSVYKYVFKRNENVESRCCIDFEDEVKENQPEGGRNRSSTPMLETFEIKCVKSEKYLREAEKIEVPVK